MLQRKHKEKYAEDASRKNPTCVKKKPTTTERLSQKTLEAHESRKIRHDRDARPSIPKAPNLEKLDMLEEILNAPMPLNDALRTSKAPKHAFVGGKGGDGEQMIENIKSISHHSPRQRHVRHIGR